MIHYLYQFLALSVVIITSTLSIEILGRLYIARKIKNEKKYIIAIFTIIISIYIILSCFKFYAENRYL